MKTERWRGRLEEGRRLVDGKTIVGWHVACGLCPATDFSNHHTSDGTIVTANLRRRGWTGFGRTIACPACAAGKSARGQTLPATADRQKEERPMPAPTQKSAAADPTAQMKAVLNAARVTQYLEVYWRDADGRYDEGWTDERIGRELGGIAPDFVRQVREALGKLFKRPSEILEAERLLEDVTAKWAAQTYEIETQIREAGLRLSDAVDQARALIAKAEGKATPA